MRGGALSFVALGRLPPMKLILVDTLQVLLFECLDILGLKHLLPLLLGTHVVKVTIQTLPQTLRYCHHHWVIIFLLGIISDKLGG